MNPHLAWRLFDFFEDYDPATVEPPPAPPSETQPDDDVADSDGGI